MEKIIPQEMASSTEQLTKAETALLEKLMKQDTRRQESQIIENKISMIPAKVICERRAAVLYDFIMLTWIEYTLTLNEYIVCSKSGHKRDANILYKKMEALTKPYDMARGIFIKLWPDTYMRLLD